MQEHNSPVFVLSIESQGLSDLTLFNCTVTFSLTRTGVHLISDEELHRLIRNYPVKGVNQLAEGLKLYFEEINQRPLNISGKSLAAEIRGHYYFEKLYLPFRWLLHALFLRKIADLLDKSLEAYDCGEAGSDPNRKIWDVLSRFDRLFSFFLRDKYE